MPRHDEDRNGEEGTPPQPLSSGEVRALRRLLKQDDRIRWFWGTVRVFALWITGVGTAILLLRDVIKALLK